MAGRYKKYGPSFIGSSLDGMTLEGVVLRFRIDSTSLSILLVCISEIPFVVLCSMSCQVSSLGLGDSSSWMVSSTNSGLRLISTFDPGKNLD